MEYLVLQDRTSVIGGPGPGTGLCGGNLCPINGACGVVACGVNTTPCGVHVCGVNN